MKRVGIICEYNPFHSGHELQIEQVRRRYPDSVVISLMSGNYVQRGDLAILPKHIRARIALACGSDLVLELPYPFSGACAQIFAESGVHILDELGAEVICFGSESGDAESLARQSENLMSEDFEKRLKSLIRSSYSGERPYADIRSKAYSELFSDRLSEDPNDILAVEYLTAMKKKSSKMEALIIKRQGNFSATAARKAYTKGDFGALGALVPEKALEILRSYTPVRLESLEKAVLARFRTAPPGEFSKIHDCPADLSNRMASVARRCDSLEEFFEKCATKKYTNARIRRAVISCMLCVEKELFSAPPLFTRLLAANERGRLAIAQSAFAVMFREGRRWRYGEGARAQMELSDRADSFYDLADENEKERAPFII